MLRFLTSNLFQKNWYEANVCNKCFKPRDKRKYPMNIIEQEQNRQNQCFYLLYATSCV